MFLTPDADDDTIAAYAVQHGRVILTADDDYLSDDVLHGLLFYEDDPAPTSGTVYHSIFSAISSGL